MTKEKQAEIVGRLTIEYSETKTYISRLEAALREVREKIQTLPVDLTRADAQKVLDTLNAVDFEEVKMNAKRLIEARSKGEELRERLRSCGVNM